MKQRRKYSMKAKEGVSFKDQQVARGIRHEVWPSSLEERVYAIEGWCLCAPSECKHLK